MIESIDKFGFSGDETLQMENHGINVARAVDSKSVEFGRLYLSRGRCDDGSLRLVLVAIGNWEFPASKDMSPTLFRIYRHSAKYHILFFDLDGNFLTGNTLENLNLPLWELSNEITCKFTQAEVEPPREIGGIRAVIARFLHG